MYKGYAHGFTYDCENQDQNKHFGKMNNVHENHAINE